MPSLPQFVSYDKFKPIFGILVSSSFRCAYARGVYFYRELQKAKNVGKVGKIRGYDIYMSSVANVLTNLTKMKF